MPTGDVGVFYREGYAMGRMLSLQQCTKKALGSAPRAFVSSEAVSLRFEVFCY
ncbi:hypothetical protein GMLC_06420 [Geomonas limicola]|uniref:Uncharacterized protein n=1 Tax=Geomonas limicola TaxID=2740186 RepID=A0A6V8N672_9BACT|nr:hypothetical protein GMLC_06420 [Geomonas limicola]